MIQENSPYDFAQLPIAELVAKIIYLLIYVIIYRLNKGQLYNLIYLKDESTSTPCQHNPFPFNITEDFIISSLFFMVQGAGKKQVGLVGAHNHCTWLHYYSGYTWRYHAFRK